MRLEVDILVLEKIKFTSKLSITIKDKLTLTQLLNS